jgi:hypothetical protein
MLASAQSFVVHILKDVQGKPWLDQGLRWSVITAGVGT